MSFNTVCLCGSTRFLEQFQEANRELTKLGMSVITISFALDKTKGEDQDPVKEILDLVHFNKILRSDSILVIGDGYIGFSTAREIVWAEMQDKPMLSANNYSGPSGISWRMLLQSIRVGLTDHSLVGQAHEVLRVNTGNKESASTVLVR